MTRRESKPPVPSRVAYHAGPAHIVFAGRAWRRGMAQDVSPEEVRGMTRRAGWVIFDFRPSAAEDKES